MSLLVEYSGLAGAVCDCGADMPLRVCSSAAGFFLGYFCPKCGPWSRETTYFRTFSDAEKLLYSIQLHLVCG